MAMKPRKVPMRMCVGCREMKPKMTLVRVVKPQDGEAHIDRTGRAQGRGAYICEIPECIRLARKSRALERALDCKIDDALFEQLSAGIRPEAEK